MGTATLLITGMAILSLTTVTAKLNQTMDTVTQSQTNLIMVTVMPNQVKTMDTVTRNLMSQRLKKNVGQNADAR